MKTIAIFNQKGGVGKTITAVNLATCLANESKRVLIIDLDGQSNATKNLNRWNPELLSTYELLIEKDLDIIEVIRDTDIENLDIVPSNIRLIAAEMQITNDTMRSRENRLKNSLREIEHEYDYCIIDCPPTLGTLVTNALVASTDVITPVKIDKFAIDGFSNLIDAIESVKKEFNPSLNLMGALITMDKATSVNREVREYLKEQLGDRLFKTTIKENVEVVKSTFDYKPVVIFNPRARASQDYIKFSMEVMNYGK